MKTPRKNIILVTTMLLLLFNVQSIFAQAEVERPMYISVTTMHWNMDLEDFDMDTWKAVEKEYMDKVTRKNKHLMSGAFYLHYFTADNTELLYVQTYATWDDIDKAGARNLELEKEAWADEASRKSFLSKQAQYYSNNHADEIYATMDNAKVLGEKPTKDLILYVRKSHFAFPDDGSQKELEELNKVYATNVFHKNNYIKGYYPNRHGWGSDKTEFVEAFFLDSIDDLDDMLKKNEELFEMHWEGEAKQKEYGKKMRKYFTGVHGDYVYTYVSGI